MILKIYSIYGTGNKVQLASQKATFKRNCYLDPQALCHLLSPSSQLAASACTGPTAATVSNPLRPQKSLKRRHQNIDCQPSIHTRSSLGEMPTTRPMPTPIAGARSLSLSFIHAFRHAWVRSLIHSNIHGFIHSFNKSSQALGGWPFAGHWRHCQI